MKDRCCVCYEIGEYWQSKHANDANTVHESGHADEHNVLYMHVIIDTGIELNYAVSQYKSTNKIFQYI